MARTTRAGWLDAGLNLLREGGQDAVTIERLCEVLGRTKGSFYHHFTHVDAYLDALLDTWEERHTSAPIAQVDGIVDGRARGRALLDRVHALDSRLDLAMRAWGLRDPRARAVVARVDERRIAYLIALVPRTVPRARRETIGRLRYAAFLGMQQLDPSLARVETRRLERSVARLLADFEDAPD